MTSVVSSKPRVFGVDYPFLTAGDVFTAGLMQAAATLGVPYAHADWDTPDLPERVLAFAPEVLVVVHGRKFVPRWGTTFMRYQPAVWLVDEPYEVDDTARWSSAFRHIFVNDRATRARHHDATVLPACYDPGIHALGGAGPARFRVGFVGGGNPTRERYLAALADRGRLDYVVGGPWHTAAVRRVMAHGMCTPAQTADLYRQTALVVNIFRDQHHFNRDQVAGTALNPRIVEATACGALVVSEWRPDLDTVAPSVPTFHSVEQCVALVEAFLADPAARAARAAACRAELAGETYAARLETILAAVAAPVGVA
jgi:Glycosyl transferases group 1